MGSELNLKLPIIDFSIQPLKPETQEWDTVRAQVRKALEEFGCFEAVFDKISSEIRRDVLETLKEIFDLPFETKLRNRWSEKNPFNGYSGYEPEVPLYESMGIYESTIHHKVETFATMLWPQGNPNFCKTIQSYSEKLSELDQMIRRMILESYGIEKYIEEHVGSTDYLFRALKYTEPRTTEPILGLGAHTDTSFITILNQNHFQGLQLRTKDGQWISTKPTTDSFIVLAGDSFYAWSNGMVHSPKHQVMVSGNEPRYSAGLFSIPKEGYIVKAPQELVDEKHPLLFNPFDFIKFLRFYSSEAGQTAENALKAYCGL